MTAVVLPVLVPLVAAVAMLLAGDNRLAVQRVLAVLAAVAGLVVGAVLVGAVADGTVLVYHPGGWPAPYGIVLVADRLAALMVMTVALLALPAVGIAFADIDRAGRFFHPLLQLLLAGLYGAFLTGDLFNLFVFFELLLLASYALLVHGRGRPAQLRAGLLYVGLNLFGSALFLVALAFLYGSLGTLNLADIARLLPGVAAADAGLVRAAFMVLVAVLLLKAAVLPVALWLPAVYAQAPVPAAALFVVLTKVGTVSLLRLTLIGFGDAPVTQGLLLPWLPVLALATIALGTMGVFAADRLSVIAAWLVLISSGTTLFLLAFPDPQTVAAMLYYLPQSTLVGAGLFLLASHVDARRGEAGDRLVRGPSAAGREWLAPAYLVLAVGLAGLPPLSGFLGKLMLLQALPDAGWRLAWWGALLGSGLGVLLVLSRATGFLFWQAQAHIKLPCSHDAAGPRLALLWLVLAGPALAVFAGPVSGYAKAASQALVDRQPYIEAVLGTAPVQRVRR